jgi:hypothetical protein
MKTELSFIACCLSEQNISIVCPGAPYASPLMLSGFEEEWISQLSAGSLLAAAEVLSAKFGHSCLTTILTY